MKSKRFERVLGYVRVSGPEQGRTGTSLDAQKSEIMAYCRHEGLPRPTIFVEVESAGAEKLDRRAELRKLIEGARSGDLVIVSKQDRWSRDTLFYLQSIKDLTARGVSFMSLAERFDPSTPEGRFSATIMAAVAEQERERIRSRTVGRRNELRAQGLYVEGKVPFGYRRERRTLVIVEEEAEAVREAFRMAAAGVTLLEIGLWLKERTGQRWDKWRTQKLIRRRLYLGEMQAPDGTWMKDTHPAIVDAATFERAIRAIESRASGGGKAGDERGRTATWLLVGRSTCALCGSRMGSVYSRTTDYYGCRSRIMKRGCPAIFVRVSTADADVNAAALERLLSLRHELARPSVTVDRSKDIAAAEAAKKRIQDQIARAARLAVDGTITAEELRANRERLDAELRTVESRLDDIRRASAAASPESRRGLLARVDAIRKAWRNMPARARREALAVLAKEIRLQYGQPAAIVWREPEELLE